MYFICTCTIADVFTAGVWTERDKLKDQRQVNLADKLPGVVWKSRADNTTRKYEILCKLETVGIKVLKI